MRTTVNQVIIYLVRERKPSFTYSFVAGETGIKEQRLKNMAREGEGQVKGRDYELKAILRSPVLLAALPLQDPAWKWLTPFVPVKEERMTDEDFQMVMEENKRLRSRVTALEEQVTQAEETISELFEKFIAEKKRIRTRVTIR